MTPSTLFKQSRPLAIHLPAELPHDVVVLPLKIEGEVGTYPGHASQVAKDLRAGGIDAAFLHDSEHRQWRVLMGDLPMEIVIGIGTGIASAASWAALVAAFRQVFPPNSQVNARVFRQRRDADGTVRSAWLEYEGEVDGFLTALPQIDVEEDT